MCSSIFKSTQPRESILQGQLFHQPSSLLRNTLSSLWSHRLFIFPLFRYNQWCSWRETQLEIPGRSSTSWIPIHLITLAIGWSTWPRLNKKALSSFCLSGHFHLGWLTSNVPRDTPEPPLRPNTKPFVKIRNQKAFGRASEDLCTDKGQRRLFSKQKQLLKPGG